MTIYRLDHRLRFPSPHEAEPDGLLAVGGDLNPSRLELAYRSGIFPWYSEYMPICWYSPDPRMILQTWMLRVNRSLRKTIRKAPYHLTMDQAFAQVIDACAYTLRPTQQGTWITSKMREAYKTLHQLGLAHSVEVWQAEKLVGGLYGVSLGGFFAGESMFSHADNASKIAFVTLVNQLHRKGIYLLDCQVYTELLAQFGAIEWPRVYFLHELHKCIKKPTDQGKWQLDDDLQHGRANCNIPKIAVET